MGILNTAQALYNENHIDENGNDTGKGRRSAIGSLATAANRHFQSAISPVNTIGRIFGHGSMVHTFARRRMGEAKYSGGYKNPKASVAPTTGSSRRPGARVQSSQSRGTVPVDVDNTDILDRLEPLDRIETNTGETNKILNKMVAGEEKDRAKADVQDDFDEEKAAEQTKFLSDIVDKLSIKPAKGSDHSTVDGITTKHSGMADMMNIFGGVLLEDMAMGLLAVLPEIIAGLAAGALTALVVGLWAAITDGVITAFETGDISKGVYKAFDDISWALGRMFSPEDIMKAFAWPIQTLVDTITGIFGWITGKFHDLAVLLGMAPANIPKPPPKARNGGGFGTTPSGLPTNKLPGANKPPVIAATTPKTTMLGQLTDTRPGTIWHDWFGLGGSTPKASVRPVSKFVAGESSIAPETTNALSEGTRASSSQIYQGLMKRGFSPIEAAAITGNIGQESGFRTNNPGDGGTSNGLMQWHNERWTAMKQFAASKGVSPYDLDAQLDYAAYELRGPEGGAFARAMAAGPTLADKTVGFRTYVERAKPGSANDRQRISYAQQVSGGDSTVPPALVASVSATMMPSTPRQNVPAATAAAVQSRGQATAEIQNSSLAAQIPQGGAGGDTVIDNSSTFGIPPQSGESIDDIVTKVLTAMGVMSST